MCALTSIFSITLTLQTLPFCCSGLPVGGGTWLLRLSTSLLFSNLIFNSVMHLYPVVFSGFLIFLGSVVWMGNFHDVLHCRLRMLQPQSALFDSSQTDHSYFGSVLWPSPICWFLFLWSDQPWGLIAFLKFLLSFQGTLGEALTNIQVET